MQSICFLFALFRSLRPRLIPREREPLHKPDELARNEHGQQRVADAPQWDIGQRQAEHHQIGGEIGPLDAHARDVRDTHGERVVAAGGAARAHGKSRADADEQRADHGGEQRHFGQLRPERRETLENGVEQ